MKADEQTTILTEGQSDERPVSKHANQKSNIRFHTKHAYIPTDSLRTSLETDGQKLTQKMNKYTRTDGRIDDRITGQTNNLPTHSGSHVYTLK